jgi:hypothetical protein
LQGGKVAKLQGGKVARLQGCKVFVYQTDHNTNVFTLQPGNLASRRIQFDV